MISTSGAIENLKQQFPDLGLASFDQIESELKIRLNIFSRKKVPGTKKFRQPTAVRLSHFETGEEIITLNLFANGLDLFSNSHSIGFNYILNTTDFLAHYEHQKTIFAIMAEKVFPDLDEMALHDKIVEFQKRWNHPIIRIADHRKFTKCYGFGLEIWIRLRNRARIETFKIIGSNQKKTIRICIKGRHFHEFSIHQVWLNVSIYSIIF